MQHILWQKRKPSLSGGTCHLKHPFCVGEGREKPRLLGRGRLTLFLSILASQDRYADAGKAVRTFLLGTVSQGPGGLAEGVQSLSSWKSLAFIQLLDHDVTQ